MRTINRFVKDINAENGRLYKEEVLRKYKDNYDVITLLKFLFDPMKVTHISTKKLEKKVINKPNYTIWDWKQLLEYTVDVCTGTDQDIANIQYVLQRYYNIPIYRELLEQILLKKLRLGITRTTVNKIFGDDFIPKLSCMLACNYYDNMSYVEGKKFVLTLKLDGIRCLAFKKSGKVVLYSRQGQVIEGLSSIEKEIESLPIDNVIFDGELLVSDYLKLGNTEAYKATTKIVRKKGPKGGITFVVFDLFKLSNYIMGTCNTPYWTRRKKLVDLLVKEFAEKSKQHVKMVPTYYIGDDISEIDKQVKKAQSKNQEGLMLNLLSEPYEFKRTKALLKCKVMQDADLCIVGYKEGTGKYTNTLGSILVEYKNNIVNVGSGLSDSDREDIWNNRDKYLNRIITVQYFEETTNANGKVSLRFPVYKGMCPEGKEVSYN